MFFDSPAGKYLRSRTIAGSRCQQTGHSRQHDLESVGVSVEHIHLLVAKKLLEGFRHVLFDKALVVLGHHSSQILCAGSSSSSVDEIQIAQLAVETVIQDLREVTKCSLNPSG
jgi:hypothetical protein